MSLYQDRVLPYLIHLAMRQETLAAYRHRLISAAEGRVLEIGAGSGLNFRHYSERTKQVIGLDPSPKLLSMARESIRSAALTFPVELLHASAEAIPLAVGSVDAVVTTWTLCTIPDVMRALAEMYRVLKPDGRFVVIDYKGDQGPHKDQPNLLVSEAQVTGWMKAAGLTKVQKVDLFPDKYFLIFSR